MNTARRVRWLAAGLAAAALSATAIGCGGGVAEARRLQQQQGRAVERYLAALDKADNAREVAAAINGFAADMERIAPRMKRLMDKHPEWKDPARRPRELKVEDERARDAAAKMAGTLFRIMPYMGDPEVRKAQERLMRALQQMGS